MAQDDVSITASEPDSRQFCTGFQTFITQDTTEYFRVAAEHLNIVASYRFLAPRSAHQRP
jgi:hypothetical protein